MPYSLKKVGIVAGDGDLPVLLAETLYKQGIAFEVLALEGYAKLKKLAPYKPKIFRLGQVGAMLSYLKASACNELVLIGGVKRPSFFSLRPDLGALRFLCRLGERFSKGDDALLKTVVSMLEKEGFEIKGADDYLPSCIGIEGFNRKLTKREQQDLEVAWDFLTLTAPFDMGQGCIVQNGRILAAEGPEGTDEMLRRVRSLGISQRKYSGLLLKKPKTNQEMRVDRPLIGFETLRLAAEAGLAGVAYEADNTFVIDGALCQKMAKQFGLFFGGIKKHGI